MKSCTIRYGTSADIYTFGPIIVGTCERVFLQRSPN
jgi:hypothetical protein